MAEFEEWLLAQEQASIHGLLSCISATHLTKHRPEFDQVVVPKPGSIVASPVTELQPGEPDYFFHWLRDGAVVMDAVARLARSGSAGADWAQLFRDHIAFNQVLAGIDGRPMAHDRAWRERTQPDYVQFLRSDDELAVLHGEAVAGDVRFNADGTLDYQRWSKPQHDGPAMRALVFLRFPELGAPDAMIAADLDYSADHADAEGYDIWEMQLGRHYYTGLVQFAALSAGAEWAAGRGDPDRAERYARAAASLLDRLDALAAVPAKDFAAILGILHAGLADGPHSVLDERMQVALVGLEAICEWDYPINHTRGDNDGIAVGRFRGDVYGSAGPWYICTFGAAEFHYRKAAAPGIGDSESRRLIEDGDATLRMARRTIPASGALTEQFDPRDGRQTSARDLGWSHAAFLTALDARRRALARR